MNQAHNEWFLGLLGLLGFLGFLGFRGSQQYFTLISGLAIETNQLNRRS
jgi:hypothetical protein